MKAKLVQLVSGVRPFTYWVATYTWDIIQYVIMKYDFKNSFNMKIFKLWFIRFIMWGTGPLL